jgi:hypothetical protein
VSRLGRVRCIRCGSRGARWRCGSLAYTVRLPFAPAPEPELELELAAPCRETSSSVARLSRACLLASAAVVPGQPTSVVATIGSSNKRTVSVAFTAPGGSPTSYLLYSVPSAGSSPVSGTSSPIVWTGGSDGDGVAYKFYLTASVRARSPCCPGPASHPAPSLPSPSRPRPFLAGRIRAGLNPRSTAAASAE